MKKTTLYFIWLPQILFFLVCNACIWDQKRTHFDLFTISSQDLIKLAENIKPNPTVSPEGIGNIPYTVLSPDGKRMAKVERLRSGIESQVYVLSIFTIGEASGRKTAFSPPSCNSVHEAARAIDIDAFDTGIGHQRVRQILNKHGWENIVNTLTGAECWHYEFRQNKWESYKKQHSYSDMAHAMKEEIGNLAGLRQAEAEKDGVRWLQETLNKILKTRLKADGITGEKTRKAVKAFQRKYGLQVDGVAGSITKAKIREILSV